MFQIIQITKENMDSELLPITNFYNQGFPDSQHEIKYKRCMYRKEIVRPIVLIVKSEHCIIGLLESWFLPKRPGFRRLNTLFVDPEFRKKGLGKSMVKKMFELSAKYDEYYIWIVNFRDSNKELLIPFYKSFGFRNQKLVGKYANDEKMWEMRKTQNNLK